MSRPLRLLAIALAVVLLLPVLAALGMLAAVQLPPVQGWAAERIERQAAAAGTPLALEGLSVSWPLDLKTESLALLDGEEPWLVAENVRLDWRPAALLDRVLHVERLSAAEVAVLHKPPGDPAPDEAQGPVPRPPQLPLAVRLDGLEIERLSVAEPVLGQAVMASASGEGALGADGLRLSLVARRTDAVPSQARIAVAWRRAADTLAVDAHLHSAPGGLAGRLLERPDLPPVTLTVTGAGPLADWRGRVAAAVAGEPCVAGTLAVAGTAEARRLGVDAAVEPACLPPAGRVLAGDEPLRLDGSAVAAADGWTVDELTLTGAAGVASVSGLVSPEAVDLAVTARTQELAAAAPLLGVPARGELVLDARLQGPVTAPAVSAELVSARGRLGDDLAWRSATAIVQAQPAPGGWRFAGAVEGDITGAALPEWLAGRQRLALAGQVDPATGRARIGSLTYATPVGRASGFGRVNAVTGALDLALGLDLLDPSFLGLSGAASLQTRVTGDAFAPRLNATFAGTGQALSVGLAEADALLGPAPGFSGMVAMTPEGAGGRLRVHGAEATANASGWFAWDEARPLVSWRLAVPDLRAVSPAVAGAARASGIAVGLDDAGTIAGTVEGRVGVAGRGPYPVTASFSTPLEEIAPRVVARGTVEGQEVTARVRVVAGEPLRLDDLVLEAAGGRLAGDLAVLADGRLSGRLQGQGLALGTWGALFGAGATGTASLDLALAPRGEGQGGELRAHIDDPAIAGLTAETLTVQANLADVFAAPSGSALLRAENVALGGAAAATVRAELTGPLAAPRFALSAQGEAIEPFDLAAQGRLSGASEVRVANLSGQYGGQEVRLLEPTVVAWSANGLRLQPVALAVGGGRVTVMGALEAQRLALEGELSNVPLDVAELALPDRDLVGRVDGSFSLSGTLLAPQARAQLRGTGLGLADDPLLTGMNARADAAWRDGRLRLDATLEAPERGEATLEAVLPVALTARLVPTLVADEPMQGRLQAQGPLGPLADALAPVGHVATGRLRAEVAVAGTLAAPVLDGTVRLENGRYENIVAGTTLTDIEAVATAQGASRFTVRATAAGPDGGGLSAEGSAEMDVDGLRYTVDMTLRDLLVVNTETTLARASGDLTFAGGGTEAALAGEITVERAEYRLGGSVAADIVTLDVVEINRPVGEQAAAQGRRARAEADEGRLEVGLSIDVTARRIFVRGRGLEAELRGNLTVAGTLEQPVLVGTLEVARGTYDLVGRTFRLREGEIIFDGGAEIDPRLAIEATAQGPGLVAVAQVSGRASDPVIDFTADPPYPSDEVLARLLFGRELGELTTAQQIQIARAVAGLAGGGGGFDPIGQLRNALGLDVLEISPGGAADGTAGDLEEETGPSISAGRYLDEDTFLRLEQGPEGGKVVVERHLGRGLSLESELGGETGGGIGLKWQRDY